jgi:nicotinamidase/pyrazinamidase
MKALILVDIQNDFLPGGALEVPEGDRVVPVANIAQEYFELVVATQDWHPPDHGSFAMNHPGRQPGELIDLGGIPQVLWPAHCVQNTPGAELSSALDTNRIQKVFHKGTGPGIDSYSAFFDSGHRKSTGLGEYLTTKGVTEVYLMGLATDYCVKFSAMDARKLGFRAAVIEDGCRGIDLRPGDVEVAFEEMKAAGVRILKSGDLEKAAHGHVGL